MIQSDEAVGLAAAEPRLQFDHRIAAPPRQSSSRSANQIAQSSVMNVRSKKLTGSPYSGAASPLTT